jgi:N,N'-diacetyllegionaminate synthase
MKIIAELCQNHNGNIDTLLRMAESAVEAGATHVKIQHVYSRNLVFRPEFEVGFEDGGNRWAIQRPFLKEFERLKSLELSERDCVRFVERVRSMGIEPLTTCFATADIGQIADQGFSAVKVASYDCASLVMLRKIAEKFDHIYVSTGATFDDEIEVAAEILRSSSKAFSMMHCVTLYPTPLSMSNLSRIRWLETLAPEVGYSDHSLYKTDGVVASMAAIIYGAKVIERHFTILDSAETKDGPVSVTPEGLRQLIQFSKLSKDDQIKSLSELRPDWAIAQGIDRRELSHEELLNRSYYRGRFASPRREGRHWACEMIMNWEGGLS